VWVSDDLTGFIVLALVCWALESILEFFFGFNASFAVCVLGPDTCSGVFVEVKSNGALVLDVFTVNASVEDLAQSGIGMGEESILSWAEVVLSLWCLQFGTISAVYVEGLIALVELSEGWVEHETIWAETFFGDSISALEVFVALHLIFVHSIFVVGALELLGI
jgi:hypothetical protein